MQYACKEPSIGANSLPFDEGMHSTNNNENRCGYGVVLLFMAGQMLATSSIRCESTRVSVHMALLEWTDVLS
jgi:hypothetical protein